MHSPIALQGALCVASLSLIACGAQTGVPRAHAPGLPNERERCRAAAANASPLLTQWSSAEKANLQARLRAGALAVEFTGCEMRPLPGCALRGSYRWQRTTLSSEGFEIRDQDELFSKLPIGALALEGELSRSGRLVIRTTVSGQYTLEGSTAADVPDYGECAQATHLLTALSIGSFRLNSGGELTAAAGASVGPYGGEARTSSSEALLREAGDFESCARASDDAPELGCSSPIQAFLVPLPRFARARGTGTLQVTFSSGTADQAWELRQNQQFVCRTPCTRWVDPRERYQLRTESGRELTTVNVPDLEAFRGSSDVEVRAYTRDQGAFLGGIIAAGLGGGFAFMGGFLALAGSLSERDGLLVAGGITSGIGALALAPGVYFLATSGAKAEVRDASELGATRSVPNPLAASPDTPRTAALRTPLGLGLGVTF
jgi:hypothetical protein